MIIKIIQVGLFAVNCVLFQFEENGILYIVDPGGDWKLISAEAKTFRYQKAEILLTHAHIDHVSAINEIMRDLNVEHVYLDPDDLPLYTNENNSIPPYYPPVGKLPETSWPIQDNGIVVLKCPGHSPGGSAYYIPSEKLLLSGDSIFFSSIGRTDLPGGDGPLLIRSIKRILNSLPGDTRIIPGHGEETTVDNEVQNNPYLA